MYLISQQLTLWVHVVITDRNGGQMTKKAQIAMKQIYLVIQSDLISVWENKV